MKQCLCLYSVIAAPTHDHIVNMPQLTKVPVKALALQHPLIIIRMLQVNKKFFKLQIHMYLLCFGVDDSIPPTPALQG